MLSSPFLLTTPFQPSSCLPNQHHTEPSLLIIRSSNLITVDGHPQPSKHQRNRKRGKLQKQGHRIEKERIEDSYFGDSRHTHSGTWKHGLNSNALVVWEEYDGPTGYFDKECDTLYLYLAQMAKTETDHWSTTQDYWLIDSSAANHITSHLGDFISLSNREKNCEVANGTTMKMTGPGHVIMKSRNQDMIILCNV